ncbi:MAG: hypothetical protein KAI69_04800 [Deltaproteobacteria bacterium]|nr:hypothetical protein [Deltaproteobacteria bacterium]
MDIISYLSTPPLQSAGSIVFGLALALLLGSSLLAFVSELKHNPNAGSQFPVMSHNITRATLIWIVFFGLSGGVTVFLPHFSTIMGRNPLLIAGLSSAAALFSFLVYHFSAKIIKQKSLHATLALIAVGSALGAAVFWYLPQTYTAWLQSQDRLTTSEELLFWWLGRDEIACFLHFLLNSIGIAALFFMLANAAEKEKKRKQSRDYYFQAAGYAGRWLLAAVTLQILPLGWLFYNLSAVTPGQLFSSPGVYWFGGILATALLGWLLLIKITKDGLVNRRATMIITLFFIISLSLFHFGPLRSVTSTATPAGQSQTK